MAGALGERGALGLAESEVQIAFCMDHPHLLRLLDVYESAAGGLDLVLEFMEGGSLADRLRQAGGTLPEARAAEATRQILLALNYLHGQGITHRDLKPDNVLFDEPGSWHLKLGDFGLSKFSGRREQRMKTCCGTAGYLAPDVLRRSYGNQSDIWSLGVIVFVLLSGRMPFRIRSSIDSQVEEVDRGFCLDPGLWWDVSLEAIDFAQSLLRDDESKRLTAQSALNHPWIAALSTVNQIEDCALKVFVDFGRRPPLQRCCISMMALLLSNEEIAKIRKHFAAIDADSDGIIGLTELEDLLTVHFDMTRSEASTVVRALNVNGHGSLHFSDFVAAMLPGCIGFSEDLLQATFKRFDKENSGYITADGLQHMIGDSLEGHSPGAMIKAIPKADKGRVGFQSFAAYLQGCEEEEAEKKSPCKCRPCPSETLRMSCRAISQSIRSVRKILM